MASTHDQLVTFHALGHISKTRLSTSYPAAINPSTQNNFRADKPEVISRRLEP
jgi:hypothetical protein